MFIYRIHRVGFVGCSGSLSHCFEFVLSVKRIGVDVDLSLTSSITFSQQTTSGQVKKQIGLVTGLLYLACRETEVFSLWTVKGPMPSHRWPDVRKNLFQIAKVKSAVFRECA